MLKIKHSGLMSWTYTCKNTVTPTHCIIKTTGNLIRVNWSARKLERLQERGLRAVSKDNCGSYDELLSKAKWPTLYNHRLQDVATLMFKVKHGICPTYISDLFNQQRNQDSLRNSDFVIPCFNAVTCGKHSIKYLGATLWFRLPRDIRNVTNVNLFEKL